MDWPKPNQPHAEPALRMAAESLSLVFCSELCCKAFSEAVIEVENHLMHHDVDGARAASRTAKILNIMALLLGLVALGVVIFYYVSYW